VKAKLPGRCRDSAAFTVLIRCGYFLLSGTTRSSFFFASFFELDLAMRSSWATLVSRAASGPHRDPARPAWRETTTSPFQHNCKIDKPSQTATRNRWFGPPRPVLPACHALSRQAQHRRAHRNQNGVIEG
jgi:hypothetical protein